MYPNRPSKKLIPVLILLGLLIIDSRADAALTFSIGNPGSESTVVLASPDQFLDVFISSNPDENIFDAAVDFIFPSGSLFDETDFALADTMGTSTDFVGDGNLLFSSLEVFSDATDVGVSLNQGYENGEPITGTPARLFRINLDASNLTPGDYEIVIDETFGGFLGENDQAPLTSNSLGLTVVAVPEPSGVLAISLATSLLLHRRRHLAILPTIV